MKRAWALLFIVMMIFVFSGAAKAELVTIGTARYMGNDYNLIYEEDSIYGGLVWLDYTRDFVSWQDQVNWVFGLGGNLTVTLYPGYTTTIDWSTGWRLPIVDESKANMLSGRLGYEGPDPNGYHDYMNGYNMVNSEMGHLFYISLGNKGAVATDGTPRYNPFSPFDPIEDFGLQNTGDFNNFTLQSYHYYWSGTDFSPIPTSAWCFNIWAGTQYRDEKYHGTSALAVHPGEVLEVIDTDGDGIPDESDNCPYTDMACCPHNIVNRDSS